MQVGSVAEHAWIVEAAQAAAPGLLPMRIPPPPTPTRTWYCLNGMPPPNQSVRRLKHSSAAGGKGAGQAISIKP